MKKKPVVCIPCNRAEFQQASSHFVKHQYVRPLVEIVGATPLLIPAGAGVSFADVADIVDGFLLTGATSHLAPCHYGARQEFDDADLDVDRDATTLPLLAAALAADKPIFAVCRGFQELNVVKGGTLSQCVATRHHTIKEVPLPPQYETARHEVKVQPGGLFSCLGLPPSFGVNSLHTQGIDKPGGDLLVEAVSDDGLIEAVSVPGKKFALGTQWHPEGDFWLNASNRLLFEGFARALRG